MTPQPCRYCGELVALDEEGQLYATYPGNKAPWTCLPSPALRHALPVSAPLTDKWTALRAEITKLRAIHNERGVGLEGEGKDGSEAFALARELDWVLATMDRMEEGQ